MRMDARGKWKKIEMSIKASSFRPFYSIHSALYFVVGLEKLKMFLCYVYSTSL